MTTPTITQSHVDKACDELRRAKVHDYLQLKNVDICNKANEIALAEQQESEYITAAQARELGAGKAEYTYEMLEGGWSKWNTCLKSCAYVPSGAGWKVKYRTIKQAQPEPVDPHADDDVIALLKEVLTTGAFR
jgi:hypothetical protein